MQMEVYRENDTFHGRLSIPSGLREYENIDYGELLEDIFRELQEEEIE